VSQNPQIEINENKYNKTTYFKVEVIWTSACVATISVGTELVGIAVVSS